MDGRRLVFTLLILNFAIALFSFFPVPGRSVASDWAGLSMFMQIVSSFCLVCLAYWIAKDQKKR